MRQRIEEVIEGRDVEGYAVLIEEVNHWIAILTGEAYESEKTMR